MVTYGYHVDSANVNGNSGYMLMVRVVQNGSPWFIMVYNCWLIMVNSGWTLVCKWLAVVNLRVDNS